MKENQSLTAVGGKSNKRSLKQLAPEIGTSVSLQFFSPKKQCEVELVGLYEGRSIVVTADPGMQSNLALEGLPVVCGLMAGNRLCTFKTQVIKALASPFPHWHLAYPKQVESQIIRQFQRIPVDYIVSVDHQDEAKSLELGLPRRVITLDISLDGMCIESSVPLGQVGDTLFVTLRFKLHDMDQVMLMPTELRFVEELKGVVQHSLHFQDLEEEARLLWIAFFYQQYLIELGYLGKD